jgi:hypothetical protein
VEPAAPEEGAVDTAAAAGGEAVADDAVEAEPTETADAGETKE